MRTPSRPRSGPARPRARLACLLLAGLLAACTGAGGDPSAPSADAVRVGTGPEAEQALLAQIAAGLLVEAGGEAVVVELADAGAARRALELGDVDVLPSYTGEAWLDELGRADPPSDRATSLARVREFDERRGLVWLSPPIGGGRGPGSTPADATFAFVVAPPAAVDADGDGEPDAPDEEGPRTLSQLAATLGQLTAPTLCVEPDFAQREDGLEAVLDAYSISREQVEVLGVSPADAVAGVAAGACVAGLTTATDGLAWRAGLRPLVDDLGVFPAFVVTLVVDQDVLDDEPDVEAALRPLVAGLTTARLGGWNARVAAGEDPALVAADVVAELVAPEGEG